MQGCGECGFHYDDVPRAELPGALRELAAQLSSRLRSTDHLALRRRPRPEVWAPLEYAAHVRDVLSVQRERIGRALVHDVPTFAPMRRDERVVEQRDVESDPEVVARELGDAADRLASLLVDLVPHEWRRSGTFPWPDPTVRDVDWMARHTVHELVHHLLDVARGLQGPTGTPHGIGSG